MERIIFHCDMNNYYASIEIALNPSLRNKPVAVCGSQKDRHGIVLAKSEEAKRYGVKTAEAIWQAKKKCPQLTIVPPHFELYVDFSRRAREIYGSYTNQVESFGLDECWLDLTGSLHFLKQQDPEALAFELKERIKSQLGLTVSIGISFNKIFAKLGSDLKKPDAITSIPKARFREIVWPLPTALLLGIGRATSEKLAVNGIHKIGEIAQSPIQTLQQLLGKNGKVLWCAANGLDNSIVKRNDIPIPAKSMGHGTTFTNDLLNTEEVWQGLLYLSQDLSRRLQKHELLTNAIQLMVRDKSLHFRQYQAKLSPPSQSALEIARFSFLLFCKNYPWHESVRALSITACGLQDAKLPIQGELFADSSKRLKRENLDKAVYDIQNRFGKESIKVASLQENGKWPPPIPREAGPPKHHWS